MAPTMDPGDVDLQLQEKYVRVVAAFSMPDETSSILDGWTVFRAGTANAKIWTFKQTDQHGDMITGFDFNFTRKKIRNVHHLPRNAIMEAIVHVASTCMREDPPKPFPEIQRLIEKRAERTQIHADTWNEKLQQHPKQPADEEPLGYNPDEYDTPMLSFVPEQQGDVNMKELSKDDEFKLKDALRYDPDGHRHSPRVVVLSSAAVFISDIEDGKRVRTRPSTMYSHKYIRSASSACDSGIKTVTKITNAQYGFGAIRFNHSFQPIIEQYAPPFAGLEISGKHCDALRFANLSGEQYRNKLYAMGVYHGKMGGLEFSTVKHIRFVATSSELRYIPKDQIMRQMIDDRVPDAQKCHDLTAVNSTHLSTPFVVLDLFFPPYASTEREFARLQATLINAHGNPYADLRFFVRHSEVIHGIASMRSIADTNFTHPDAAVIHYDDARELNTRLCYGLRDESAYADGILALLERRPGHMTTIAIPGTKVHKVQGGWLAVFEGFDLSLLPKIGEIFKVRLPGDIEFQQPEVPELMAKHERDKLIVGMITAAFTLAGNSAPNDRALYHSIVREATEPVIKAAPPGAEKDRDAFIDHLVYRLMPRFSQDGDERPCASPDDETALRKRLQSTLDEEGINANLRAPSRVLTSCPDMLAVRIAADGWTETLGNFQALLLAPRAPNTPVKDGRRPIIKVTLPSLPLTGTNMTDVSNAIRRHGAKSSTVVHIIRSSHDGNLKAGMQACAEFCADAKEQDASPFHAFARHWAKGRGPSIPQDASKLFTGLQDLLHHHDENTVPDHPVMKNLLGKFRDLVDEQQAAFRFTTDLPFGTGIISGCPGSGKTALMVLFLLTLSFGQIDEATLTAYTTTALELPNQEQVFEMSEALREFQVVEPANYTHHLRPPRESRQHEDEPEEEQPDNAEAHAFDVSGGDTAPVQDGTWSPGDIPQWGNGNTDAENAPAQDGTWSPADVPQWGNGNTDAESAPVQDGTWSPADIPQWDNGEPQQAPNSDDVHSVHSGTADDNAPSTNTATDDNAPSTNITADDNAPSTNTATDDNAPSNNTDTDTPISPNLLHLHLAAGVLHSTNSNDGVRDADNSNGHELVPTEDTTFGSFPPSMAKQPEDEPVEAPVDSAEAPDTRALIPVGTIAIVAPTNKILDEIAKRIFDMHQSIAPGDLGFLRHDQIVRPQMPEAMVKDAVRSLTSPDGEVTVSRFDDEDEAAIMTADLALGVMGEQLFADKKLLSPRHEPGQFSEVHHVIDRIKKAHPQDQDAEDVANLLTERTTGLESGKWDKDNGPKRLAAALRALKSDVLKKATFILATPEVLNKIGNQSLGIKFHAVWIDEAFRMTEPDILVPFVVASNAGIRILTGDIKQMGAIVMSENAHLNKDESKAIAAQFAPQLATSGAARKLNGGHPTHYLTVNHRAKGGVSAWPSRRFYAQQMVETTPMMDWSPEQARARNLLAHMVGRDNTGAQVICNMPGSSEMPDGTSWKNHSEAKLILRIVLYLHENVLCREFPTDLTPGKRIRILIITPYDAQAKLIRNYLAKIPACHVVANNIENLVPQSAQGLEAEIVISGITRDGGVGYVGQSELVNVTHTRAIWGVIQLVSTSLWSKKGNVHPRHPSISNIVRLFGHVDKYGGVLDIKSNWFAKPVEELYTIRCPVCPRSQSSHMSIDCDTAKASPMSEIVPAGTILPKSFTDLIDAENIQGSAGKGAARQTLREMYGLDDISFEGQPVRSKEQRTLDRAHLAKDAAAAYHKHRRDHRQEFRKQNKPVDGEKGPKYVYPAPRFKGIEDVKPKDKDDKKDGEDGEGNRPNGDNKDRPNDDDKKAGDDDEGNRPNDDDKKAGDDDEGNRPNDDDKETRSNDPDDVDGDDSESDISLGDLNTMFA